MDFVGPLVLTTYSVLSDQSVVRLDFHVAPGALQPGCVDVARRIAQSIPRRIATTFDGIPGDSETPEHYEFRFVVPNGYILMQESLRPHGGRLYRLQRLGSLLEPRGSITLFSGQSLCPIPESGPGARAQPGTLFGVQTEWSTWSESAGGITLYRRVATIRDHGPALKMRRVELRATDPSLLTELEGILGTVVAVD
jgi:hypothetical protein